MNYLERLNRGYTSVEAKYMDVLERNEVRDQLERNLTNLTKEERQLLNEIYAQEQKELEEFYGC